MGPLDVRADALDKGITGGYIYTGVAVGIRLCFHVRSICGFIGVLKQDYDDHHL
jgi:hypothetical protein